MNPTGHGDRDGDGAGARVGGSAVGSWPPSCGLLARLTEVRKRGLAGGRRPAAATSPVLGVSTSPWEEGEDKQANLRITNN